MRRIALAVALACLAIWTGRAACAAQSVNLAHNGNLATGAGTTPADWYALSSLRKLTHFSWWRTSDGAGVAAIDNPSAGYASWHQALYLAPGRYLIGAQARADKIGPGFGAATIAVQTFDGMLIASGAPRIAGEWRDVGFTLRIHRWGETTELLLQLGMPKNPGAGRVSFRDVTVTALGAAANPTGPVYDPDTMRSSAGATAPSPWDYPARAVGVICGIGLLVLLGWALAVIWRPAFEADRRRFLLVCAAMTAIAAIEFAGLFHFTGFYWDIWSKTNRALLASALGPFGIYAPGLPVDSYPPGSLYLLWLSGWIGRLIEPGADGFRVIVEAPPVAAILLIGITIYAAALRRGKRSAIAAGAMLCFAINPALMFDIIVWGQNDSVVVLPMLAAAVLVLAGRHRLGWCAAGIALLAKPQAIALLPPLGLLTLFDAGIAECAWCAAGFLGTIAIGAAPFQLGHSWNWVIAVYRDLGTRYSEASVGAFNFLGLIGGIGSPDSTKVAGVSYYSIGLALTCAAYAIASYLVWRARDDTAAMIAIFTALFGFFLFAPRMHERYLYYSLAMLAPIALDSGALAAIFSAVTATFLFNLLYVKRLADRSAFFPKHPHPAVIGAELINLAAFAAIAVYGLIRTPRRAG
ncbi:MAG: glycosyltransferase 87 family protein [Candidatus Binataceae bacterium]